MPSETDCIIADCVMLSYMCERKHKLAFKQLLVHKKSFWRFLFFTQGHQVIFFSSINVVHQKLKELLLIDCGHLAIMYVYLRHT